MISNGNSFSQPESSERENGLLARIRDAMERRS